MSGGGMKGGRRIPTPMPPPNENVQYIRSAPRLVGSDASYKFSPYEMEALNAVKATAPKMDRNGYFFYVTATAKKKKISLMQTKPPRVAFAEEKRRPERMYPFSEVSTVSAPVEYGREMTQRGPSPAPRARLYSQLESYQPRYHTIRENSDKRVESDVRRRKKDQRIVYQQSVGSTMFTMVVILGIFWIVQYQSVPNEIVTATKKTQETQEIQNPTVPPLTTPPGLVGGEIQNPTLPPLTTPPGLVGGETTLTLTTPSDRRSGQKKLKINSSKTEPSKQRLRSNNFRRNADKIKPSLDEHLRRDADEEAMVKIYNCGPDDPPCFHGLLGNKIGS